MEEADLDLNVEPFPQSLLELALGAPQDPPRSLLPYPQQNFPLFDPGMSDSIAPVPDAEALRPSRYDATGRSPTSSGPIVVSVDQLFRGVRSISRNSSFRHLTPPPAIHDVPAFTDTTSTSIHGDLHHDAGTQMLSGLQVPCLGTNATVEPVRDNQIHVSSIRRCFVDHLDVPEGIFSSHLHQNGSGDPQSLTDHFVRQPESESASRSRCVSVECNNLGSPLQHSTADLGIQNTNRFAGSSQLFNGQSGSECDQTPVSQRSPRSSMSHLQWLLPRRRSSVFSRALSQVSVSPNGAIADRGIGNVSGFSRNAAVRNAEASTVCEDVRSIPELSNSKGDAKGIVDGSRGAEFECNICLEMASEPVVTCCGHLFCWPCLYQWLHVHSIAKMCPVCKGFLSDSAIIPIYGRGLAQDTVSSHHNTPARPHAHRISRRKFHWEQIAHNESSGPGVATEVLGDNTGIRHNSSDDPNATNLILERLRVAHRLQQEYFERRSGRLSQRLMARRGEARRTPLINNSETASLFNSSEPRELRRARHTLETAADDLAAIQASIDGLRANMQRLVEFVSRHNSTLLRERQRRNVSSSAVDQEMAFPLRSNIQASLPFPGIETQMQSRSMELPESNTNAANSDFGSCEAEVGLPHAQKRHRFN